MLILEALLVESLEKHISMELLKMAEDLEAVKVCAFFLARAARLLDWMLSTGTNGQTKKIKYCILFACIHVISHIIYIYMYTYILCIYIYINL